MITSASVYGITPLRQTVPVAANGTANTRRPTSPVTIDVDNGAVWSSTPEPGPPSATAATRSILVGQYVRMAQTASGTVADGNGAGGSATAGGGARSRPRSVNGALLAAFFDQMSAAVSNSAGINISDQV